MKSHFILPHKVDDDDETQRLTIQSDRLMFYEEYDFTFLLRKKKRLPHDNSPREKVHIASYRY